MVGTNSYVAKLKAQLDRAIIQGEHWKQLAENRNSILVTEVCPESRSVEEHIIDADSVRASWRLMRGYREQIEALRAENGRLQADRDRANQYANQQALECNKLSTDLEAARGLLERVTTSFTIEAYGSALHDARQFLAAALAPEVQASGPYASVAGALAQRYPKPSLLKDCNVSYSNSSRPLAEQGERQEAVAWALANSADEIGGFAPIYYTKEGAISWANGRNIFPLYTTPQPGQDVRGLVSADDVRDACANAVSVFAEEVNADQCREVAEYMREVLLAQIAKQQAKGKGGKHE